MCTFWREPEREEKEIFFFYDLIWFNKLHKRWWKSIFTNTHEKARKEEKSFSRSLTFFHRSLQVVCDLFNQSKPINLSWVIFVALEKIIISYEWYLSIIESAVLSDSETKKFFLQKEKKEDRKFCLKCPEDRERKFWEREKIFRVKMMKTKTLETESNESYTISNTINKQINKFMTPPCDLLTWKDMPEHLQFNPYVHTGN